MTTLIDIYPRDVCAIIEHRKEELEKLWLFLNNCSIQYSAEQKEIKDAAEFVKTKLFPDLESILKTMKSKKVPKSTTAS